MKKLVVLLTGLFLVTFTVQNLNAQHQATGTGDASARIIKGIAINQETELDFGTIISMANQETVTIDASSGARTSTNSNNLTNQFSSLPKAGEFKVTGEANATYTISLPTNPITIEDGSNNNMSVDNFTHNLTTTPTLDNNGEQVFKVGAQITINAGQAAGNYTGTYTVTVDYQ